VPLNEEGQRFFQRLAAGRTGEEILLLRVDGEPWRTSQQARRLRDACQNAKIVPAISFHVLRHTYGSILVRAKLPAFGVEERDNVAAISR
jgi:site-specific recombinase XerD